MSFNKLATNLAVILISTLINVIISYIVSAVILLQMVNKGHGRISLFVAVMVAIVTYLYISYNHKLKNLVEKN